MLLLALLACTPTPIAPLPPQADAPDAFASWHAQTTDEDVTLTTRTWTIDGKTPTPSRTLDGLVSLQPAGPVRLTELHKDEPTTVCEGRPATNRQAAAGLSRPGREIQVLDMLPDDPAEATFQESIVFDGIVGDVAFVRARSTITPCTGAARTEWQAMEIDLSQGYTAEVFTPEEREATMNALRPTAFQQLKVKGATATVAEDLIWSATRPIWQQGTLGLQVLLTSEAAEGDGIWSHGTIGVWLDAPDLPARLKAYAHLPAGLGPFVQSQDGFIGLQQLTDAERQALEARQP